MHGWCLGLHIPGGQSRNTLHLPAEPWPHAPECAGHNVHNPGLFHALGSQRGICIWGFQYSFGNGRSLWEPLYLAGISGTSSHGLSLKTLCEGPFLPQWGLIFLAGSTPDSFDGLASTAIWANCHVGDNSGDLPTSSNFSTSNFLLSISVCKGGASLVLAMLEWKGNQSEVMAGFSGRHVPSFFIVHAAEISWIKFTNGR